MGRSIDRAIDDHAERAFAAVLRHQNDGAVERRLPHLRRCDQELAGQ